MNNKKRGLEYILITIGSITTALAINIFLAPYKIAPGGVTGIATVIHHISGNKFPLGVTMLTLNIPLFIAGIKYIGGKFVLRTLYSTVFLSLSIDIIQPFTTKFTQDYLTEIEGISSNPDLLLYSIFGGTLMGIGLGLVFKAGASTGGTDLAAKIFNHFIPAISIGRGLLLIDVAVVVLAAIFFKSLMLALYATVTLFICSKIIDAILEGVNYAKAVFIISDNSESIADEIMNQLDRGVTGLKGKGMYSKSDKQVLYCIVHRNQIPQLKEIVKTIDEKAFVILTEVREVLGEGFLTYD